MGGNKKLPAHFVSAGGLVYRDGKVLLIKSERRGWEFLGGVIEQGEPILDGLKREIFEESGITAEPTMLVGIYQNLALKQGYGKLEGITLLPVVNFDFICTYVNGTERVTDESVDVGWFTPEEARNAVKFPGYVERLANMLDFGGGTNSTVFATYEKSGEQFRDFRQVSLGE